MSARAPKGKRCGCRDPETGKQLGAACPKLRQRHHGTYEANPYVDTTTGRRKLHRGGFESAEARKEFVGSVRELVRLADDDATRNAIGDMIFEVSKRNGKLPS